MQSQQKEKIEKTHLQEEQMQSNKPQIVRGETGSRKMTMQFRKQFKKQSQAGYMQSNKPQIMGGETGNRKMITQLNKSHLKHPEMQGNEAQNRRQESENQKMLARQDKMSKTESQSGEMMIKNIQNKKENAKNELTLSEQYIHKKNIIKTQSQSGRSMVEMLGVLAIIGVLSIGGIAGYKYAMNYYQANQIAHEMNIMRTDAQVKIAQGVEELVLGNPYDDGNINFNNYETDFDCVYMENEEATPELAFCTAANSYYIEMKNIPEGVCRPLANLIDKMDNEIAFYINEKSVDAVTEGEKGACNEEPNTLRVIFGADSDSNAIKCDDDTNCPTELPVCFNHMCVECKESNDCGEFEVCDQQEGTCTADCTKGECNNGFCVDDVCKECRNREDCNNGLACIDNQCMSCESESDCEGKHCIDAVCVDCTEPTPKYNATENKCVECTENSDCESKTDTPVCNRDTNKCVECKTDEDCLAKGTENPICNKDTNTCERCPDTASRWDGKKCVGCNDNDDCPDGKYCDMDVEGCTNGEPYGKSRRCWVPQYTSYEINGKTYYKSKSFIDWWAAGRFCERVGEKEGKSLRRVSLTELGCDTSTCNNETNSLWKQLKAQGLNDWLWTSNEGTDCQAYIVDLEKETVLFYKKHVDTWNYETDALCVSD